MEILSKSIWPLFFLLVLFSNGVHIISARVYNIVPTLQISPYKCPVSSCLTLSQFAQNSSHYIALNTTLILSGGNHTLEAGFSVSNITKFVMLSASNTNLRTSKPVIICTGRAKFKFTKISNVYLNGLKFEQCNASRFEFIYKLSIQNSVFIYSQSPVTLTDSKANFVDTVFYFNSGKYTQSFDSKLLQRLSDNLIRASLGGALMVIHSIIAVENCSLVGNTANFGGAIYSETNSSITIIDSNFTDNRAKGCVGELCSGGAILIDQRVTMIVINTIFTNNTSGRDGGVATIINANLLFSYSIVHRNTANRHGGAVAAFNNSNLTIKSTELCDNMAVENGGAVYLEESNVTVDDCEILCNNAGGDGGAVYEASNGAIQLNNSILENNQAQKNGGALYGQKKCSVNVSNCLFINNTAENGGVARITLDSALYLSLSNFSDNNAKVDGGVAFIYDRGVVSVKDCSFVNNWAGDYGGALRIERSGIVIVSDSDFVGNRAAYGGALEVNNHSNASIASSNFSKNSVKNKGAAIQLYVNCAAAISGSIFSWNEAGDLGAGVYGRRNCIISIRDSLFYNNTAEYSGAGMYIGHGSTLGINNSTFLSNTADFGAAVVAQIQTSVTIANSSFNQNRAAIEGGALHTYREAFITIENSSFTFNKARSGGVVLASSNCKLKFNNSILYNNSADSGAVIAMLERSALIVTGNTYVGSTVVVINSIFNENTATIEGGVLHAYWNSSITIESSSFSLNKARSGGVYLALLNCKAMIKRSVFSNNSADFGGVIGVLEGSTITIIDSIFHHNMAKSGGVLYAQHSDVVVKMTSIFNFNSARLYGGVIYATDNCSILMKNSTCASNIAEDGGVLSLLDDSVGFIEHSEFIFNRAYDSGGVFNLNKAKISVSNGQINDNIAESGGGIYLIESSLYFGMETTIYFNRARFLGGGIHAINSSITVKDTVHFVGNKATSGGGLSLSTSKLFDMIGGAANYLNFVHNEADYGGALYVNLNDDEENNIVDVCSGENSSTTGCFFDNVSDVFMIKFDNNHANFQGDNLFGGLLDRCTIAKIIDHFQYQPNGIARFTSISNITSLKTISSKPVKVCPCENKKPNCSIDLVWPKPIQVKYRGTIVLPLAAVDQVYQTVTATIKYYIKLSEDQETRTIGAACSYLRYHIMAPPRGIPYQATIYADGPCGDKGISKLTVNIDVVPCTCAPGFLIDNINNECECNCDPKLLEYGYITDCDPETESVKRKGVYWVTITNKNDGNFSYLIFPYCPMVYCQSPDKSIYVNLTRFNGSDSQCTDSHGGLLCGKCQLGYSLSLGSSKCIKCHKQWHGQLIGIVVAALFAGIFLVAIILMLNLTVAVGTLNSIIFYANIVHSNRISTQSKFGSVFIAWLNLDVGFDICFCEGMDAYTKTWLQLAFPAYIIFLVIAIIWISSCSSTFSNLIGKRNPVATLATLILVSYAKLLQTIIITFSYVISKGSTTPTTRWLYDASIMYFGWKHALLFCTAVLILILGLFYTILLFSWQWLLHCPRSKFFNWTRNQRLHTFIDTYHTPHTARHHYWTGLLLLIRVILYLIAAFNSNVYADPHVPLLATIIVICCLLLFRTVMMIKVYRNWLLNAMDSLMCFNIIIPTIFILYSFSNKRLQTKLINISTGITITLLCFIITFHIYRYSNTKLYAYCQNTRLCKCMAKLLTHSQDKSSCLPSADGRLLDVLNGHNDEIHNQHEKPTSSVVSMAQSEESPSSDNYQTLNEAENQSDHQLHINEGKIIQQERAKSFICGSTQQGSNNTKKIELSSYFSQDDKIRKPLLEESL